MIKVDESLAATDVVLCTADGEVRGRSAVLRFVYQYFAQCAVVMQHITGGLSEAHWRWDGK